MRILLLLVISCACSVALAADRSPLEARKIEYLIGSIEALHDVQFIRNGASHDAKAAGSHLRLKLLGAGSRVATADDFIRLCATGSSLSGKPYQLRFGDGRVVTAEAYLRQRLLEFPP